MEWKLKENFPQKKLFGLTGGIASGKSLVGKFLSEQGAVLVDTDKIYHSLLTNNHSLMEALKKSFETADRAVLSKIVFGNPEKLELLNNITHPFIRDELYHQISILKELSTIVIEATLLFESGLGEDLKKNIVVTAPLETRVNRLMNRNNLSREQALLRINSQNDDQYRVGQKYTTYVIENNSNELELLKKIEDLYKVIS